VRRARGEFDRSPDPETAAAALRLAADWYNDGPEPFDWWIARADLAERIIGGDKDSVALAVLRHIHEHGLDAARPSHHAIETLRFCGHDRRERWAALVLRKVCPPPALPVAQRHRACAARKRG
jgi:hypothetical protein